MLHRHYKTCTWIQYYYEYNNFTFFTLGLLVMFEAFLFLVCRLKEDTTCIEIYPHYRYEGISYHVLNVLSFSVTPFDFGRLIVNQTVVNFFKINISLFRDMALSYDI